jgi:hypothetical protein
MYLARSVPTPNAAHLRDLLTNTSTHGWPDERRHMLAIALDLMGHGWLDVELNDGRGPRRLYASFLTFALDDLLDAMTSLTRGVHQVQVSWDSEPTEYRWLCTTDSDRYTRVRILQLSDRAATLPDHEGHPIIDTDLPLPALLRSVTSAARELLTRIGEDGYARRWGRSFPTSKLQVLERWLHDS